MRTVLVCPSHSLSNRLQAALARCPVVTVRVLDYYPSPGETVRLIQETSPDAMFIGTEDFRAAAMVARAAQSERIGTFLIAVGESPAPEMLLTLMRAGFREFLESSFDQEAVDQVVLHARQLAQRIADPTQSSALIVSVLPARPGVGATTTAVNLAVALAGLKPSARVLLLDLDLSAGLVGFLLKLDQPHTIIEATHLAWQLDESLWSQLVCTLDGLDVLPSGKPAVGQRIEQPQVRSLLDFARRRYSAVVADHSGSLEKHSLEILYESDHILLVCTSELPSLHLAREKLGLLQSLDLENKVRILLNRVSRHDVLGTAEVEELLGHPVFATLPNDYRGVHRAIAAGRPVAFGSLLGRQFQELAKKLTLAEAAIRASAPAPGDYPIRSSPITALIPTGGSRPN